MTVTAPDLLRRKAREYRALCEEHCEEGDPSRLMYLAIEAALVEVAGALDRERQEQP